MSDQKEKNQPTLNNDEQDNNDNHGLSPKDTKNLGDACVDSMTWAFIMLILPIIIAIGYLSVIFKGFSYAIYKSFKSIKNFFTGNKMLRSAFRIASTAAGGYGGAISGIAMGTAIAAASALTSGAALAVIIIAAIANASICAGLGAWISKKISQGLSKLFYGDTNPEKWSLSKRQTTNLKEKDLDPDKVKEAIDDLKTAKQSYASVYTPSSTEKNEAIDNSDNTTNDYNTILAKLKDRKLSNVNIENKTDDLNVGSDFTHSDDNSSNATSKPEPPENESKETDQLLSDNTSPEFLSFY